jgi:7,8-dihydropterin-6-yl-methyl-4-(beta-D-ribofuranosyl)aminobenzene 5'-phosphate synthase
VKKPDTITLTVLYDNNRYEEALETGWGFSCLIKRTSGTVLFDTGGDGAILLRNMSALGVDPKGLDDIVISHGHGDHTGGVWDLAERNRTARLWVPVAVVSEFRRRLRDDGERIVPVSEPVEIQPGVWSTGQLVGRMREQSLIVMTDAGLVIITGCAHPGIIEIVARARELFSDDIRLVLGGFHLLHYKSNQVGALIDTLMHMGVERVAPTHCTGDVAIQAFRDRYGSRFEQVGVGRKLVL